MIDKNENVIAISTNVLIMTLFDSSNKMINATRSGGNVIIMLITFFNPNAGFREK
jgi:hypothetical protein